MPFLLALLLQADPAVELVRALNAESAEERSEAVRRLKQIGPAAVPALRAAADAPDPETRGRAAELLEFIARNERIKGYRPSTARIRLRLDGVPFAEAVEKAMAPFGADGLRPDADAGKRPVKLDLQDAGFWEAVEALEAASGLRYAPATSRWQAPDADRDVHARAGDVRLTSGTWGGHGTANGPSKQALFMHAWLSPGTWASSIVLEDVELSADGKRVDIRVVSSTSSARRPGQPSKVQLPTLVLNGDPLKGGAALEVRGTMILGFPRDVERYEAPLTAYPAKVQIAGGSIELRKLGPGGSPGWWDYGFSASGGREVFGYVLSVEDAGGRFLADVYQGRVHPNSSHSASGGIPALKGGPPARMVVLRPLEEETLRVPFVLQGLRAP